MDELRTEPNARITIFTIGFGEKTAEEFFGLLRAAGVRTVIDVRLYNISQLAGFTKKADLAFFLRELGPIGYEYRPELAPSKEILEGYRKKLLDWTEYERRFQQLMVTREVEQLMAPKDLDGACLLCSEPQPARCHRRLVAEYLLVHWGNVDIVHLQGRTVRGNGSGPGKLTKRGGTVHRGNRLGHGEVGQARSERRHEVDPQHLAGHTTQQSPTP